MRAGRYAACFQGRDAAHELTWDLCGKSHLFQPGMLLTHMLEIQRKKREATRTASE